MGACHVSMNSSKKVNIDGDIGVSGRGGAGASGGAGAGFNIDVKAPTMEINTNFGGNAAGGNFRF
jgi:hypothetical protein